MNKLLILILILPLFVQGQPKKNPDKTDIKEVYTQAIGDFIKAANQKNKTGFDTIYLGKVVGQSGAFPDIKLPEVIENTVIKLVTQEEGAKGQKTRPSRIYINMPAWVNKAGAEFIFVVFTDGFKHQYDYTLKYKYNPKLDKFELVSTEFKGPPFN